jgi:hypothetical protein
MDTTPQDAAEQGSESEPESVTLEIQDGTLGQSTEVG